MKTFSEYHLVAAVILTKYLQIKVDGYNTLCSCQIEGKACEVVFKGQPTFDKWLCSEAIVTFSGMPKKRSVVNILPEWDIDRVCSAVADEIKRITQINNVVVGKSGDAWHAVLEHNSSMCGSGKTHLEAIGDLVFNNADAFGIEVKVKS